MRRTYVCPICGTEYNTADALAKCVVQCEAKELEKEKENAAQEKAKLAAEQSIAEAYEELVTLVKSFNKAYPNDTYAISLTKTKTKTECKCEDKACKSKSKTYSFEDLIDLLLGEDY